MAHETVVTGGVMMLVLLSGVGGVTAILGVVVTDVQQLSFGETNFEPSELIIRSGPAQVRCCGTIYHPACNSEAANGTGDDSLSAA